MYVLVRSGGTLAQGTASAVRGGGGGCGGRGSRGECGGSATPAAARRQTPSRYVSTDPSSPLTRPSVLEFNPELATNSRFFLD